VIYIRTRPLLTGGLSFHASELEILHCLIFLHPRPAVKTVLTCCRRKGKRIVSIGMPHSPSSNLKTGAAEACMEPLHCHFLTSESRAQSFTDPYIFKEILWDSRDRGQRAGWNAFTSAIACTLATQRNRLVTKPTLFSRSPKLRDLSSNLVSRASSQMNCTQASFYGPSYQDARSAQHLPALISCFLKPLDHLR